jgi:hypothetical protein
MHSLSFANFTFNNILQMEFVILRIKGCYSIFRLILNKILAQSFSFSGKQKHIDISNIYPIV